MPPISKQIEKGLTPEELLEEILGNEPIKFLETMPVSFTCTCSKERFGDAIISLGADEIQDMIERMDKLKLIVISVMKNLFLQKRN